MASQVLPHQHQQQFRTSNQSSRLIMTEQQPSRSSNHLSPSAAAAATTGRPDEPAEGHLFGPQPAEAGHSDADSPTGENNENNNDDPSKHHVGPVMGIFFKVWSLVKVTKVRHHNQKMRRQNSEDTGHFQYISGDQLAASSGSGAATAAANNNNNNNRRPLQLLQDGHFRRAGSQPAPSCSGAESSLLVAPPAPQHNLLQVSPSTLTTTTTNDGSGGLSGNLTPQQSTTNSTSSGVSSTTSSTLAEARHSHNAKAAQVSLRRGARKARSESTKQAKQTGASRTSNGRVPEAEASSGAPNKTSTWTSKIKRSATTVNQSDLGSYVSRYRFRRPPNNELQMQKRSYDSKLAPIESNSIKQAAAVAAAATTPQVTSQANQRHARAQSEAVRADDIQKRRHPRPRLWSRDAISVQDDDDDEDHHLIDQMQNEDDSDLNDIYSTPNDSIHSVPNSAPLGATQPPLSGYFQPGAGGGNQSDGSNGNLNRKDQQQGLFGAANNQSITKSFSANNFSQLIKQDNNNNNNNNSRNHLFDTIQEHQFQQTDKNDCQTNQRLLSANNDQEKLAPSKKLSGSRFFISSSSSEDSNPPSGGQTKVAGHPQQQQQQNHQPLQANKQQHKNIPVNFGLHYHHEPSNNNNSQVLIPIRPDSLQVGIGAQFASNFVNFPVAAGGLVTPTFLQIGCPPESVSIAAMSPAALNPPPVLLPGSQAVRLASGYRKSPSLFEISANNRKSTCNPITAKFSSKFPAQQHPQLPLTSTFQANQQQHQAIRLNRNVLNVPNSISLHDCKMSTSATLDNLKAQCSPTKISHHHHQQQQAPIAGANTATSNNQDEAYEELESIKSSEYKLAQMLLELGSNSSAKDQIGCTALMHAVLSDNLPALRCLIEHGVDLDDTNSAGLSALDLVCAKRPNELRLEMLKLLIESRVDLDKTRPSDGSRLLDRLIGEHRHLFADKLAYIDCLLHNGAKLGSSTWTAASGKHEIQLRLLKKLCQDGYFLYKKCSIEPAVYRFEYALKRIAELEHQLANGCCARSGVQPNLDRGTLKATQQIKYQTYLGLSRCERKRKFFKRALEFAHMSILVDSTAYEGYYSKAHILKDLGEIDESLAVIEQTARLVEKSVEVIKSDLSDLQQQEESIIFDGCFDMRDPNRSRWIQDTQSELLANLDYLEEAKKHIARLRDEILHDKSLLPVT